MTDDWFFSLFAELPGNLLVELLQLTPAGVPRASLALVDGGEEAQDQWLALLYFSLDHVVGSSPSCLSLSLF